MSQEKFGIENLQKVLSFGVGLGAAIAADAKDGFNLNDIFQLLPQLMQIPDFIKNKDAIVQEAKDLSLPEIQQLVASVDGAIKDEHVSNIIEHALSVVVAAASLVQDFKSKTEAQAEPEAPETPAQ